MRNAVWAHWRANPSGRGHFSHDSVALSLMYSSYTTFSAPCPEKKWPPSMDIRLVLTGPSIDMGKASSIPRRKVIPMAVDCAVRDLLPYTATVPGWIGTRHHPREITDRGNILHQGQISHATGPDANASKSRQPGRLHG